MKSVSFNPSEFAGWFALLLLLPIALAVVFVLALAWRLEWATQEQLALGSLIAAALFAAGFFGVKSRVQKSYGVSRGITPKKKQPGGAPVTPRNRPGKNRPMAFG